MPIFALRQRRHGRVCSEAAPIYCKPEDGQAILEAIEKAKQTPVLRPYDKKKAARTPATPKTAAKTDPDAEENAKAGLCPWLPTFSQLRGYLAAIDGVSCFGPGTSSFGSVGASWDAAGTCKLGRPGTVDRGASDRDVQSLAKQVWSKSKQTVNPRYLRGPGIVADRYDLAEKSGEGKWVITAAGRDLLDTQFGATEKGIDLQEAWLRSCRSSRRSRTLVVETSFLNGVEFVTSPSDARKESVVKHFLYNRLQNLMDRKLVERDGQRYRLTKAGEDYLDDPASGLPVSAQSQTQA